jgi:acyl-coenzyme A thioesterase PaaI-like protein
LKKSPSHQEPEAPSAGEVLFRARRWLRDRPDRLIGHGHPAGDFLHAYDWVVLAERPGFFRLDVHLPEHVKNPRGQLFGGFTPTYVDLVALFTVRAGKDLSAWGSSWLATTNMRIDYFEPVTGPRFVIESELRKERGRLRFVETRFLGQDDTLLVFALTTMREVPFTRALGDV